MYFRKKPVTIEARLFSPDRSHADACEVCRWCDGRMTDAGMIIPTLEGDMLASPGDWIIKGVAGEFYPCKPDVFARTYTPAAEAA